MNLKALAEKLSKLYAEGVVLQSKSEGAALTDDEQTRFDAVKAEIKDLQPKFDEAKRQAQLAEELRAGNDAFNAPANPSAARQNPTGRDAPQEGNVRQFMGRRAAGRTFTRSEQYKRAMSSGQSKPIMRNDPVPLGSLFAHRYGMDYHEGETVDPRDVRAVIGSATPPASLLLPQVVPTIFRPDEDRPTMRDVVINAQTTSDTIRIMQELVFTNNAAEVAEAIATDGVGLTGGVKPESAITFQEVDFPVQTIAHWIPVTRQLLQDIPAMESYINDRLLTGLLRRESGQIINGDGVTPNLRGLLNTTGIQEADGVYFGANPVADPGTANENMNRIRRARRLVDEAGATATFVVVNPADAEVFDTMTDAQRQYMAGGPFSPAIRTYWGMPVVEEPYLAEGTAIVGDGTMAAVYDRMQGQIYTTDSHSDFFIRNLFVILAEERLAFVVYRPSAFVAVTLA